MKTTQRVRKKSLRPSDSLDLARAAAAAAAEMKAFEIAILKVGEVVNYADYFVIASARSARQAQSVAENVEKKLRGLGVSLVGTEGGREGSWILIDWGDVVVHVFHEPVRQFYEIENLWADAPRIEWTEKDLRG